MSLAEAAGHQLEWRQAEFLHRAYQLMDKGQELGLLVFESSSGSRATANCGGHAWTFKRTGFFATRVTVREPGSDDDLAVFTTTWTGGGSVTFNWGPCYHLRKKNFWGTEWAFEGADGTAAVSLSGVHGVFKEGGAASVAPSAAGLPETPVLLLLIWYVRILANEDAGAAAVVCTVG